MCNRLRMKIKSTSVYAPKEAFIPCGECYECRAVQRSAWTFRLRVELEELVKRGWWLGFLTLTYNDSHLPHIPRALLRYSAEEKYSDAMPMCFSKDDCRHFLTGLRQYLTRVYDCVARYEKHPDGTRELIKDDKIRFMLCSEYGENTHRCHYHLLLALPPHVPALNVFNYVHEKWEKGFVFPKDFNGGFDSHGYDHKPFVVDSVISACSYVSKYVCKDLAFFESFDRSDFQRQFEIEENEFVNHEIVRLSDYMPFHMQSKSLGLSFVQSLSDSQKLEYLKDGVSFVGAEKLIHLPVYIRNKLIFDNYYIVDSDGKRLCRRKANDFLNRHYEEIYETKRSFIESKIQEFFALEPKLFESFVGSRFYVDLRSRLSRFSIRELSEDYTSFGGVPLNHCFDVGRALFWLARYGCCETEKQIYEYDFGDASLMDNAYLADLNCFMNLCFQVQNSHNEICDKLLLNEERTRQYYIDLFTSQEY